MKQLYTTIGFFIIGACALGGIFTYGLAPILTMYEIKTSIDEQDSRRLARNIDFPTLRTNLKQQLHSSALNFVGRDYQSLVWEAAGSSGTSRFSEKMITYMVTPSGLTSLMLGKRRDSLDSYRRSPSQPSKTFLSNAQFSWDSMEQFSVWATSKKGGKVGLVLTRSRGDWKLSDIVLSGKV